jgi:hypothetical protein
MDSIDSSGRAKGERMEEAVGLIEIQRSLRAEVGVNCKNG